MVITPLFNWLTTRTAGVLLHPTSLPGETGIGTLGAEAFRFIDVLSSAHFRYWQLFPLGPTGYGDSPYQCFSAFAGNPYLIDFTILLECGLLSPEDLRPLKEMPRDLVDYGGLYRAFWPIMRHVHANFVKKKLSYLPNFGLYEAFKKENESWLRPYATFMALKRHFGGKPWYQWPPPYGKYSEAISGPLSKSLEQSIESHVFYQYLFFGHWKQVKRYAGERGVEIIGDLPIFVALDSADVWANPEIFQINKDGSPRAVAGVPPDYFSKKGQLWGNPLYDWKYLRRSGYQWWLDRIAQNLSLFDVVRLDHFRGFESYWRVPASASDARKGRWVKGPGFPFLQAIRKRFPDARMIAEDLGEITPGVRTLLEKSGLPGMSILQFAFSSDPENLYLPHNHQRNCVCYPGTHDNDTTHGWYLNADTGTRDFVRRYLGVSGSEISWDLIRAALRSVCHLSIIPLQDLLNLNSSARMNKPGSAMGNWQWRCSGEQIEQFEASSVPYLRGLLQLYDRGPKSK